MLAAAAVAWWRLPSQQEKAFEPLPLTTYPGSENDPSFSTDGNQIAFARQKSRQDPWEIYVKLIGGGGPPLQLTSDVGRHTATAWSPDGKWIAYFGEHPGGRSGVYLVPALGGPERLLAEGVRASALDWSPDGKWLSASPGPANVGRDLEAGMVLVSAETGEGKDLAKQNADLRGSRDGRFSPDGKRLAYLGGRDYASQVTAVVNHLVDTRGAQARMLIESVANELDIGIDDGHSQRLGVLEAFAPSALARNDPTLLTKPDPATRLRRG